MANQMIFQRYEMKYVITAMQKEILCREIAPYITEDRYFHSSIRNLYYDTPSFQLIRDSLDRPIYKEKLRMRSYGRTNDSTSVFVELKKKYESVVYKRRITLPMSQAAMCLSGEHPLPSTQIGREIQAALNHYNELQPRVFLSYERDSFCAADGSGLRLTFDDCIHFREDNLTLDSECDGTLLLPQGMVLMELKLPGVMPLWMAQTLSRLQIYKTTFSKYGTAYQIIQAGKTKGAIQYAG